MCAFDFHRTQIHTETFSCLLSSHMYNMSYFLTLSFVLSDYVKLVRLLNFPSFAFKLTQSKMYGIQFICKTVENVSSANMGNGESNRFKLVYFFFSFFHSSCLFVRFIYACIFFTFRCSRHSHMHTHRQN